MTPTQLKTATKKPLTTEQVQLLIGAITEFYATVQPELIDEGIVKVPAPPEAPNFFQFKKWPAFFKAFKDYVAKWKRIGAAVVHLIEVTVKIFK